LAQVAQKTPLRRIPLLLSDVFSGLLPSHGPGSADAEACFECCGNVFTDRCQATYVFYGSAILTFSRQITICLQGFTIIFHFSIVPHLIINSSPLQNLYLTYSLFQFYSFIIQLLLSEAHHFQLS
jgi:hypothetical protein